MSIFLSNQIAQFKNSSKPSLYRDFGPGQYELDENIKTPSHYSDIKTSFNSDSGPD
jgi:hypothetical protein